LDRVRESRRRCGKPRLLGKTFSRLRRAAAVSLGRPYAVIARSRDLFTLWRWRQARWRLWSMYGKTRKASRVVRFSLTSICRHPNYSFARAASLASALGSRLSAKPKVCSVAVRIGSTCFTTGTYHGLFEIRD
jgi:protein-S-isoprenylcysteine O-methyltransferase Ste14